MTHEDTRDPFDRKVAALMQDLTADVTPPPAIPRRVAVRARLGQAFIVGGVAVSVLLIVVAAGAALRASGSREPIRPIATPTGPSDNERGSGGTYPCTVEPEPYQPEDTKCVATGEFEGTEWSMVTYTDKHGLCVDVSFLKEGAGGGGGGGCGRGEPRTLGVGISSGDEQGEVAYGEVSRSVAQVVVERESGDAFEVELYPAPEGSGLDLRFYLVFLPEDHAAIVANDSRGEEIDRQKTNHEFVEPEPLGPPETVATGDVDGEPWVLKAYQQQQTHDSISTCTEFMFGRDEMHGGGGSCSLEIPGKNHVGFSESGFGREFPDLIALFGVVSKEVADLSLELDDGRVIPVPITTGPAHFEVAFFVAFPKPAADGTLRGHLVARDSAGEVIDRSGLCDERIAGRGLTCGK